MLFSSFEEHFSVRPFGAVPFLGLSERMLGNAVCLCPREMLTRRLASGNVCDTTFEVIQWWHDGTMVARHIFCLSILGSAKSRQQTAAKRQISTGLSVPFSTTRNGGLGFPALCRGRIPRIADYV